MRLLRTLLIGCALLLPRVAFAQDSTATTTNQNIAPSHLAVARQLVAAVHMIDAASVGMQVALDEQVRTHPMLAPYRGALMQWATELLSSEEAQNGFARLYAEEFTEDELRQILAFYQSPVGQKLASRQANLGRRGAEFGRTLAEEHQADLFKLLGNVQTKP